jgi:serine/threonine protein kinase/AmiR/NasT family two-component response regulator
METARKHCLLVVDDEAALVHSIQDLLKYDYRVLGTTGAVEALKIMEREEVHVVLTDQRMPEMTGVEFLRRVRELYPDVVRLIITAYSDMRAVIDAINEGRVYRYINKPFDALELQGVLRQAVEHYELVAARKRLLTELEQKNQQLEQANAQLRQLTAQLVDANAELLKSVRKDKQQLGQYQLLEKLAKQGNMGTVYKALHILLMKVVALKVLPAERMGNTEAVARFRREMKAIGRLNHPNIVQAMDAGEVDGTHFLVMEFIDGIDLATLVARCGQLPVTDACALTLQAALGLQHAHEHALVHRDLKPSNMMLTPHGLVKILDLGLAHLCDEVSSSERLTALGQVMGTAEYMAPEQAFDTRSIDIRADVYALGCTLYHFLTGRPPFGGPEYPGRMNKLVAHAQAPVPPIGEFRPEVPQALRTVLEQCLAKDPAHRYPTPAAVVAALEPFTAGANLDKLYALAEPERGLASPNAKTTEPYSIEE